MPLLNFCLADIELTPTVVNVDDGPFAHSDLVGKPEGNGYDKIIPVYLRDLIADQMQITTALIERDSDDQTWAFAFDWSMKRDNLIVHLVCTPAYCNGKAAVE
jgi:hypothetical protein